MFYQLEIIVSGPLGVHTKCSTSWKHHWRVGEIGEWHHPGYKGARGSSGITQGEGAKKHHVKKEAAVHKKMKQEPRPSADPISPSHVKKEPASPSKCVTSKSRRNLAIFDAMNP